jgi:hypothetical protein
MECEMCTENGHIFSFTIYCCIQTKANPYISQGWPFRLACSLRCLAQICPAELRSSSTPELSAALTASALVRFLLQVWSCSAPLQPSLRLPFPATPLLLIFCAHLTLHRSLSCSISHFPPEFPSTFMTALCPIWHICCHDTGCECLPLLRFPFLGYRWNCLVLYFPEPNNTPIRFLLLLILLRPRKINASTYRQQNQLIAHIIMV